MEEYYLGLDIGTNSVGWAVTDRNYNLIRNKGKDLWGVRLFVEAKTASNRRGNRSVRKRNDRKRNRLQLLRELFEDEIKNIDQNFFVRLDESKYWLEDKRISGKDSLFHDKIFTDKEYFKKYPTIFHLRKDLIEHNEKKDIRLYFLAINQMMKRRGHFLIDGEFNNITDYKPYLENLKSIIEENIDLDYEFYQSIFEILLNDNLKSTDKKIRIKDIISRQENLNQKQISDLNAIFNLIVTGKINVNKIFHDEEKILLAQEENKKEFDFNNEKYQENLKFFEKLFGYDYQLIENLKAIYDFILLYNILQGHKYLSDSKVEQYETHRKNLKKLKQIIKKYDCDHNIYRAIFKDKNNANGYVAYLGYCKNRGKKETVKKCSYENFKKFILSELKKIVAEDNSDYLEIIEKFNTNKFLSKQIVSTNSVLPHQVHLIELKKILENLVIDYPSFEKIEDGFRKVDKIEKIFNFRIPYYVGPLNDYHKNRGGNAWVVKNEAYKNQKIRPWNFEKIINLHKSEEEFIKRMINECSYLPNEKVLPKASLLYQEFMVLNELNSIKINGEKISPKIKQKIISDLYQKSSKIKLKDIRNFFVINNYIEDTSNIQITGIDTDIKATLNSYIEFKSILGDKFDTNMVEDIIEQLTIHVGNQKLLKEKITEKYPKLSERQLNQIISKKYKDWGRLSRKLLQNLEGLDNETGQVGTILYFMRESNDNFMQILSSKYSFIYEIDKLRQENLSNQFNYNVIDSLYTSPSVKKMIWQVSGITSELIKVLGAEPKKIFIEMARGKEDKPQRKNSRKTNLIKLYESIKGESSIFDKELVTKLNGLEDKDFKNRALFLYFIQNGRCMYSGEKIELDHLYDKQLYDLDHIIPRKLKKDDSIINNLVLVKRNLNQNIKKDIYPLPDSIRNNKEVRKLWEFLYEKKFIEKEKYERLIRKEELTDQELAEFINRQLVETRQSTKLVKEIFEKYYQNSKIITVKAGLVSELRKDFKLLKSRELNDLHHAHDAYLNIVVGDVWNRKFTSNPINFVKSKRQGIKINYSLNIFNSNQFVQEKEIWNVKEGIEKIKNTLNKASVLFSNESFRQKGELYNATIVGKKDIKSDTQYLSLKKEARLCVEKYGGYKSISGAYFFLVEHIIKKEVVKSIEMLPIYYVSKVDKNKNELLNYCKNVLKLENPRILIDEIKYKTEIEVNDFRYLISGKTGQRLLIEPNVQMFWQLEDISKFKLLSNKYNKYIDNGIDLFTEEDQEIILQFIQKIIDKFKIKPYKNRLNIPKIDMDLINSEQSVKNFHLLLNLIKLTNKTVQAADLTDVHLAKTSGRTSLSKNIAEDGLFIITKSITGIFEKKKRIR